MYKIVDYFNGFEDDRRFEDDSIAQEVIEKEYKEFAELNPGAKYCRTVVPASHTWYFDQRQNKFMWG